MLYELCSMASAFITDRHGLITKISESLGSERQLRAEEEKRNNLRKKEERELEQKEADRANANQLSLLITEGISRKELLLMDRNEKETKRLAEEAEVEARAVVVETSSEISVPIWTSSGERLAKVTLGLSIVGGELLCLSIDWLLCEQIADLDFRLAWASSSYRDENWKCITYHWLSSLL